MEANLFFDHRRVLVCGHEMMRSRWMLGLTKSEDGGEWDHWGERVGLLTDMVEEDA